MSQAKTDDMHLFIYFLYIKKNGREGMRIWPMNKYHFVFLRKKNGQLSVYAKKQQTDTEKEEER